MRFLPTILAFFLSINLMHSQQPKELGTVNWIRNYDEAIALSGETGKNIFLLFQEVPGCATCQRYGQDVLSHPLIVEAIEDEFIPLAIYNNKGGHDGKILKQFNEPSWNNPVVRIIDANGDDATNRVSGNYSAYGIISAMIDSKERRFQSPPVHWSLMQEEFKADYLGTEEAVLSMYCFWTGERELGKIPGVSSTEAGFMNGKEVVKIKYSPDILPFDELVEYASNVRCADQVFTDNQNEKEHVKSVLGSNKTKGTSRYSKDREDKYYLLHSNLKYLPLTEIQKTRINSMLGDQLNPSQLLSQRQLVLLNKLDSDDFSGAKVMVGEDFLKAWEYYKNI